MKTLRRFFRRLTVTGAAEPELPRALMVTHGVLDALDVKPLLGRWFSQADDTPGSPETVILTHGYWRRRFLGDTSIIGRAMTIDSRPHTVIGDAGGVPLLEKSAGTRADSSSAVRTQQG